MKYAYAALALIAAALAGCDHHADVAGPAGLPYACADGRAARIYYDGGDPNRVPARLAIDGREFVLHPAPALNGLRYASETGLTPGHSLVWWAQGDEASLIEVSDDPAAAAAEREVVRCARVREGDPAAPDEAHGSHSDDH